MSSIPNQVQILVFQSSSGIFGDLARGDLSLSLKSKQFVSIKKMSVLSVAVK